LRKATKADQREKPSHNKDIVLTLQEKLLVLVLRRKETAVEKAGAKLGSMPAGQRLINIGFR